MQFTLNSSKVSFLGSEGLMLNSTYVVFLQLENPLQLGIALLVGGLFLSAVVTHSAD